MPSTLLPRLACSALVAVSTFVLSALPATPSSAAGLTLRQLNSLRSVTEIAVSPAGDLAAYVLQVPRTPGVDEDGQAFQELHVVPLGGGPSRGYVTGDVRVSDIAFTADGKLITYLATRHQDEEDALWAIPVAGGESRKLLEIEGVVGYSLSPAGPAVALVVDPPDSEQRKEAKEKGYDREVFEEEWRPQELWITQLPDFQPAASDPEAEAEQAAKPRQIELEGSVASVQWAGNGSRLAVAVQPRNLVDDSLMFKRLRILDVATGEVLRAVANPGKLGDFRMSSGGQHVAMISAADLNDPREGRLMVASVAGEEGASGEAVPRDLMPDYQAHVAAIAWRDDETLLWSANEGAETTLGSVGLDGTVQRLVRSSQSLGVPVSSDLLVDLDGKLVMRGESPSHPFEVFVLEPGGRPRRLTDSNPWLAEVRLARQEVVSWTSSDGLSLEGVLMHPLDGRKPAPLLLMVHGGPESHDRNGWLSAYSRPGQVAAARGYAVLYPNYRGSTGRGVASSKLGQGDAAGPEFRDLVEAVDHLATAGIVDRERVGITGGSYGGYATAWCSTYYSDRFKAGVMFVGISNKVSKGFTTDIPREDVLVHTLYEPWTKWQFSLERSPIFHAEKSSTPLLIAGGTADTRVHPSQSLQLYRALKGLGKTVRYVLYPGEPHGNRRATSREDYGRRLLRWMDHFVMNAAGDLPPVELD